MTQKQREAYRLLRDHGDPSIGHGGGVITSGETGLYDGQPWINWQTAEALERRHLARCVYIPGDFGEITLVEGNVA